MADNNKNDEKPFDDTDSTKFNIESLFENLSKCCSEENALSLDHYIVAFKELYRFFTLLGSVFGFVASDIISKVSILQDYRTSENSDRYVTIQSMIDYEIGNGITAVTSSPSGSRTLLRLHRALEFVTSFMQDFSTAELSAKSSAIAQKCYKSTLSKFHPWLIQKGAYFAMYSLPVKQQFIERVLGHTCDKDTAEFHGKLMGDIAVVCKKLYDETHKLYEANGILDLP